MSYWRTAASFLCFVPNSQKAEGRGKPDIENGEVIAVSTGGITQQDDFSTWSFEDVSLDDNALGNRSPLGDEKYKSARRDDRWFVVLTGRWVLSRVR